MNNPRPMHWNQFTRHPLDHLNQPLPQSDGTTWTITQNMRGEFIITRNGEQLYATDNSINVCFWLNVAEVSL